MLFRVRESIGAFVCIANSREITGYVCFPEGLETIVTPPAGKFQIGKKGGGTRRQGLGD
jgi:hypothetical protein